MNNRRNFIKGAAASMAAALFALRNPDAVEAARSNFKGQLSLYEHPRVFREGVDDWGEFRYELVEGSSLRAGQWVLVRYGYEFENITRYRVALLWYSKQAGGHSILNLAD